MTGPPGGMALLLIITLSLLCNKREPLVPCNPVWVCPMVPPPISLNLEPRSRGISTPCRYVSACDVLSAFCFRNKKACWNQG